MYSWGVHEYLNVIIHFEFEKFPSLVNMHHRKRLKKSVTQNYTYFKELQIHTSIMKNSLGDNLVLVTYLR